MVDSPRLREVQLHANLLRASYEQGVEQGRKQAVLALARQLLAEGEPAERVARLTGLSLDVLGSL
jgi:hypothetical protein